MLCPIKTFKLVSGNNYLFAHQDSVMENILLCNDGKVSDMGLFILSIVEGIHGGIVSC